MGFVQLLSFYLDFTLTFNFLEFRILFFLNVLFIIKHRILLCFQNYAMTHRIIETSRLENTFQTT